MSQEAKLKISLDDQVSSTARVIGKNIQGVAGDAVSLIADGFVKTLAVGTEFSGKLVGEFRDLHNALVGLEKERTEVVAGQLEERDKAFKDHFESIARGFGELSEQIVSDSGELIESISEFPKAFEEGFSKLEKITKSPFKRIRDFGEATSKNLNDSFQTFFVSKFRGETASLGGLFKNFANTMKANFLNALAEMAAAFVTSKIAGFLTGGLNVLGFSQGGIVPEDGLAAVRKGELIVDKSTVTGLAGKGISKFGPETAETLQAGANLLKGAGGGFLGNQLAGLAFGTGGVGGSVGGAFGGGVGFALGGPFGAGIGSFIGTGILGGIGKVFGFGGPKLNESEKQAGDVFKQINETAGNFDTALALTALKVGSGTGFDSLGDGISAIAGQGQIPDDASSFIRLGFLRGLTNLVNDPSVGLGAVAESLAQAGFGGSGRAAFLDGRAEGVSIERDFPALLPLLQRLDIPRFRQGIDFVPFDDFPALLHRGERVLTESENRGFAGTAPGTAELAGIGALREESVRERQKTNRLLEDILRAVDRAEMNVQVVTPDGEVLVEESIKELRRQLKTHELTIHAGSIVND